MSCHALDSNVLHEPRQWGVRIKKITGEIVIKSPTLQRRCTAQHITQTQTSHSDLISKFKTTTHTYTHTHRHTHTHTDYFEKNGIHALYLFWYLAPTRLAFGNDAISLHKNLENCTSHVLENGLLH